MKQTPYEAPAIEIIEMETEGAILTGSPGGNLPGIGDGEDAFN